MQRIRVVVIVFLSLCFFIVKGNSIDSLKKDISSAKHDTIKLYSLNRLIEISPDKEWQKANLEMGAIAKRIIDLNKADKRTLHVAKRFYAAFINNNGYAAFEAGNVGLAIESYHKSLKIYESLNEVYDVALAYNNLGFMYSNEGDDSEAMKYYQLSLKAYQQINHEWGIALCYNNIALLHINTLKSFVGKNTDSVNYYFSKSHTYQANAKSLHEKGNNKYGLAISYNNLGTIYSFKAEDYLIHNLYKDSVNLYLAKSIEYFNKGLLLHTEFGNSGGIFDCTNNLGFAYFLKRDFRQAIDYCTKALKIAQENKLPHKVSLAAKHLYRIYDGQNDASMALKMYMLHMQMRDSVANEKNKKALIQKEFQYQYDKKVATDSIKAAEEKKVTDAQLAQEKTRRFALVGGLILVLVFSGFLYNRFRITMKQKLIIELKERETQKQNIIISEQKQKVEEHQKEILDSIHYAKRIQNTLLAHNDFLNSNLPDNFVFFKPKDIVSGDFYWATKYGPRFYLAVCDSTGHGVPGAFMSLLNINFLNEAINEKDIFEPHEIFNYVRRRLISSVSKDGQQDGFDGILLCFDTGTRVVSYAAANNAPVLVSGNEYVELAKDKMPVGKGELLRDFTLHTVSPNQGDVIYLYTDGYADQFGGPKGKKFKYRPLNELLLSLSDQPMTEQMVGLNTSLEDWKGNLEQVDDILVIGIKF